MNKKSSNNKKIILVGVCAFTIGLLLSGGVVKAVGELLASNIVYDNSTSGLTSTDVQSAINELNTKANRKITGDGVANVGFQTNSTNTIFANSNGLCIVRKGNLSCFKNNNWAEEQTHIQQSFSDISCNVNSSKVSCNDFGFLCSVSSNGLVSCSDLSNSSYCNVTGGGSVNCY